MADVCLDARDAVLMAALVRALVETAAREWEAGLLPDMVSAPILRQAAWRASRFGAHSELLHPVTHRPAAAKTVFNALYDHVRDALDDSGDGAHVATSLQRILEQGTGSTRQRQVFERYGSLADVVAQAAVVTQQEPGDDYLVGELFLSRT